MPTTSEAFGILLLLLPGFACAYIVEKLTVRKKQSDFDKVIEAFLFSLILYIVVAPFFDFTLPLVWNRLTLSGSEQYILHLRWLYLAVLAICAAVLAIIYSANLNHDWVLRLLRKIGVTQRTARNTIWNDTFQDIQASYVLVEIAGNRRLIGFVRYYSDDPEENSIFLEDAAWILDDEGTQQPILGPGILLTRLSGIESISFLGTPATNLSDDLPTG